MAKKARGGGGANGNGDIVLNIDAQFGSLSKQLDNLANRLDGIIQRNIKILDQFEKINKSRGKGKPKDRTINADDLKAEGRYLAERAFYIKQGREEWQKENGLLDENQKLVKKELVNRAAILAVIRKTTQLMVKSIKISADWAENLNLFAVTFGKGYEEAVDWAVDFADKLGYSSVEIVKFTGLFKQLSDAIGVTAETGKEVSKVLTQLGADISSFYNISLESAMEKLQAGIFSGQTKPLRSVGIDVTYQSIDNLLATNEELAKLGVTSKKLTQDQKVLARTILVATAAMNAWGDSAKTINSLANQVKVFQGSVQNLALAIGDMIAPMATQFLTILNGIVMAMTSIIRVFVSMVKQVPYEVHDMKESVADEYAELAEETGKLLSFDKFEALNSAQDENTNATLALTLELQKTIAEYNKKQADEMERMQNAAIEVRNAILGFLGVEYDEEEKRFVTINNNLKIMGLALGVVSAASMWKWLNSVGTLRSFANAMIVVSGGTLTAAQSMTRLQKASSMLSKVGIIVLIAQIIDLVNNWEKLNDGQKTCRIIVIGLTVALIAYNAYTKISTWLNEKQAKSINKVAANSLSLKAAFGSLALTVTVLVSLVAGLVNAWSEMDGMQKTVSVLLLMANAFFAVAIAVQMAKQALKAWSVVGFITSAGAALAMILSAKSDAFKFGAYATGGTPDRGEIFSMNEYGRPEAFVKSGGHTSVINDVTMGHLVEQGVENAIRRTGLIEAVRESRANISIQGDAQQIFKVVDKEGRRVTGKGWTQR